MYDDKYRLGIARPLTHARRAGVFPCRGKLFSFVASVGLALTPCLRQLLWPCLDTLSKALAPVAVDTYVVPRKIPLLAFLKKSQQT